MRIEPTACRLPALGVVVLFVVTPTLFAQVNARQSNGPASGGMQEREWALTHVPDEVNKHFRKEQVSLFSEIREDFTRIQVINNEMMKRVFVNGTIDGKLIAATSEEINKRARRLSENLALPKVAEGVETHKPDEADNDPSLKERLSALDRCVMSFVANPLFKQPNVVGSDNALKARDDLNQIIRLSKLVKISLLKQPADSKDPVITR